MSLVHTWIIHEVRPLEVGWLVLVSGGVLLSRSPRSRKSCWSWRPKLSNGYGLSQIVTSPVWTNSLKCPSEPRKRLLCLGLRPRPNKRFLGSRAFKWVSPHRGGHYPIHRLPSATSTVGHYEYTSALCTIYPRCAHVYTYTYVCTPALFSLYICIFYCPQPHTCVRGAST